jgi:hypothetical protein
MASDTYDIYYTVHKFESHFSGANDTMDVMRKLH